MGCTLKSICRLKRGGFWHPTHWSFDDLAGKLSYDPYLMDMPSDAMTSEIQLRQNYLVNLPLAMEWLWPDSEPGKGCHRIFTDGSKTGQGSGAGVFVECENVRLFSSLGKHASVFQAEIYAILMAMRYVVKHRWKDRSICVCSDSQAALKALRNPSTTSKLVQELKISLNLVGRLNALSLVWVPGHTGVQGNEISDELARLGSEEAFSGPEPVLGLPASAVRNSIDDWVFREHKRRWHDSAGCRQTKRLLPDTCKKSAAFLLSLRRCDARQLVGVITGHFAFAKHLNVLGLSDNTICLACEEDDDTSEHFLCYCPAFARSRWLTLGADVVRAEHLSSASLKSLLVFLRKTRKFPTLK